MKKKLLLFSALSGIIFLTLTSSKTGPATSAVGDRTGGGAGSGGNCGSCHGGGGGTTTGTVEIRKKSTGLTGPTVNTYEAFTDYYVTVKGTNASLSHFGFQVKALNSANASSGTFSNFPADVHPATFNNRTYVEHAHQLPKDGNGEYSATFEWTAPPAGAGTITFFGCLNAVNDDDAISGDKPSSPFNVALSEVTSSVGKVDQAVSIKTYPNPFNSLLNIDIEKGSTGIYHVIAFDVRGKQIHNSDVIYNGNLSTLNIHTNKWAAGTYFVQIAKDGFSKVVPVVKQ